MKRGAEKRHVENEIERERKRAREHERYKERKKKNMERKRQRKGRKRKRKGQGRRPNVFAVKLKRQNVAAWRKRSEKKRIGSAGRQRKRGGWLWSMPRIVGWMAWRSCGWTA